MNKVAVFGSLNMDILVEVPKLPEPNQTITADAIDYKAGGKGVNQAAAAAAAGASTIIIGTVGEDAFGQQIVAQVNKIINLDGSRIINTTKAPTGLASIMTSKKDNMIAIVAGANMLTDKKRAEESKEIFDEADVLLVQFEIPLEAVACALKEAHSKKTITILNIAPFKPFDLSMLDTVDLLVANDNEFADLADYAKLAEGSLETKMSDFQKKYPDTRLIVTRGAKGLCYVEGMNVVNIQAIDVKEVDSTGSGDTFCGVLGALLAASMPFEEAVYKASVAAGLSVEHKGALGSAPTMEKIDLFLSKTQEGADNTNY